MFCGGLNATLPYYNSIHIFNKVTLWNDVHKLFASLKLSGRTNETVFGEISKNFPIQKFETKEGKNTCEAPQLLANYYNDSKLINEVVSKYRMDYALFNISIPCWTQNFLNKPKLIVTQNH